MLKTVQYFRPAPVPMQSSWLLYKPVAHTTACAAAVK